MTDLRIIKYVPKITSARTEYREIAAEELEWLQAQMVQWLTKMSMMDQAHDEDTRYFLDQWWHKKSKKLHRGQQGPNTPCSVVGGVLDNFMFKDTPQRDFSSKQMEDIEYISHVLSQAINITAVRFQIGFDQ
jgi:hypothetical protein